MRYELFGSSLLYCYFKHPNGGCIINNTRMSVGRAAAVSFSTNYGNNAVRREPGSMLGKERASDVAHQEMQAREKQKCRGASRGKGGPLPACFSSSPVLGTCTVQNSSVGVGTVAFRAGGSGWQKQAQAQA